MIYLKAFVVGGLICTLVQIFLDNTKLMPGRVMVLLVIAGVILGAAGLYEPLIKWAGCGASVGTSSALIFSYIASLIFQPKMKR